MLLLMLSLLSGWYLFKANNIEAYMISHIYLVTTLCGIVLGQTTRDPYFELRWNYDSTDHKSKPENWANDYPACGAQRQSPIDINTTKVQFDRNLHPLHFEMYRLRPAGSMWTVTNNGHAVQFSAVNWLSERETPGISHGGLPAYYNFLQLHFHWGAVKGRGSEHSINGVFHPLELHLVHQKTAAPPYRTSVPQTTATPTNAVDGTGLAVVSVLFRSVPDYTIMPNRAFQEVIDAVHQVRSAGSSKNLTLPDLVLEALLPRSRSYFRYLGSLTTPPCTESAVWSVMEHTLIVNEAQMNAFRSLFENTTEALKENHRPIQPLNGRAVTYYAETVPDVMNKVPNGSVITVEQFIPVPFPVQPIIVQVPVPVPMMRPVPQAFPVPPPNLPPQGPPFRSPFDY